MDNFIIIDYARIPVPFECLNWVNAPDKVKKHTKVTKRTQAPRIVMIHTVHGRKCKTLKPGGKPSTRDLAWARSHWTSKRKASVDAYIDTDGSAAWANDPATHYTWGCGAPNRYAFQIELVTDNDGQLYQATLDTLGEMLLRVCPALKIQLQTAWDHETNTPYAGRISRLDPKAMGARIAGIFGHRNVWGYPRVNGVVDTSRVTAVRGFGDPNSFPFEHLVKVCGVEKLSFIAPDGQSEPEDVRVWRERQTRLGITPDGLPLAQTREALFRAGYKEGIWAFGR